MTFCFIKIPGGEGGGADHWEILRYCTSFLRQSLDIFLRQFFYILEFTNCYAWEQDRKCLQLREHMRHAFFAACTVRYLFYQLCDLAMLRWFRIQKNIKNLVKRRHISQLRQLATDCEELLACKLLQQLQLKWNMHWLVMVREICPNTKLEF